MIEKTVFTEKEIIEEVKKNYNIDIYKIDKLNRGSANIYSLNNDKYILKEFQTKYSQEEIDVEINIISILCCIALWTANAIALYVVPDCSLEPFQNVTIAMILSS